ncbi:hypothetical protein COOONC_04655 [Cooperia oncophora]
MLPAEADSHVLWTEHIATAVHTYTYAQIMDTPCSLLYESRSLVDLIRRFVSGDYTEVYDPTIEDRHKKTLMYNGKPAHLEILDTSGKVR